MDLGEGYSLHHIARWWHAAKVRAPGLPDKAPPLGFACMWKHPESPHNAFFICSMCLFPTDGEWILAEYLVTRQSWMRQVHRGLELMVPHIQGVALAHGKRLMFPNSSKGVRIGLERLGVAFETECKVLLGTEVP